MRGLVCLVGHLAAHPSAIVLLTIHYLAYHGLPILMLISIVMLSVVSPIGAVAALLGFVLLLARLSGQSLRTAATFVAVFPIVHCVVTLLWLIPMRHSYLARR